MKKIISLILAIASASSLMLCASAASKDINVYLDGYSGSDGQKINFDVPPQTINDRTMVPIRAIFEAMGATVSWDEDTKTAISTKDSTTIKMTLNSTTEYINDTAFEMDVTPVVINGRTLAPARYVAEAFGYIVKWDEPTKSVLISPNNNYDISQIIDGTREHPFKLGDSVTFDFWDDNNVHGNCTLSLNSYLTADEASEKFDISPVFDYITGHIKLNEFDSSNFCSNIKCSSEAVTSNLRPLGNYMWFNKLSGMNTGGIRLYSGGETDCYIPIPADSLTDGETIDYFSITYLSESGYKDTKTIWFSLK